MNKQVHFCIQCFLYCLDPWGPFGYPAEHSCLNTEHFRREHTGRSNIDAAAVFGLPFAGPGDYGTKNLRPMDSQR